MWYVSYNLQSCFDEFKTDSRFTVTVDLPKTASEQDVLQVVDGGLAFYYSLENVEIEYHN